MTTIAELKDYAEAAAIDVEADFPCDAAYAVLNSSSSGRSTRCTRAQGLSPMSR